MTDLRATAAAVLTAGAAATIAFDLFGQTISPLLSFLPTLGAKLAPVPLAQSVLSTVTGIPGQDLAREGIPYGLHILTGLVAYPLGWLAVREGLARTLPGLHWSAGAVGYGVLLWVFALYGMAHLVAGNPAFLGFTGITWVALWGHVVFALTAAAVLQAKLPQPARTPFALTVNRTETPPA
ncbi:MAG: hypothetical protein AAGI50_08835 [Pseudomonadota bacterium]